MTQANRRLPFEESVHMDLAKPISTFQIFAKGLWRSLFRTQGSLVHESPKKIVVDMKGIRPEPGKVNTYRQVCGYPMESDNLPITFPETLFISPLGMLVTSHDFPLSPAGLIHVGQDIRQIKPIPEDSYLDLCCSISELSKTERGFLLDIAMEVRVEGELVWEGMANFLSRFKKIIKKNSRKKRKAKNNIQNGASEDINVPKDTGLLYARASGDYNPHHLYGFTAKPLGYKRPIAHGMWSLAKSLAIIENSISIKFPYSAHASFKLPIYMPSTVSLNWERCQDDNTISFALTDAKDHRPHVNGALKMG